MKLSIALVSFLFLTSTLLAQQNQGSVTVVQSPLLDALLLNDQTYYNEHPQWDGFRVQIFFDAGNNSKSKAIEVIESFIVDFPDIPAFLSFKEPYYRVRVGNYYTRLQAAESLSFIVKTYPGAFVVKESINPNILSQQKIDEDEAKKNELEQQSTEP